MDRCPFCETEKWNGVVVTEVSVDPASIKTERAREKLA